MAEIAEVAAMVNEKTENIGARRLYTILERLLDEISFEAPGHEGADGNNRCGIREGEAIGYS